MTVENRPWSEVFLEAATQWVDSEAAAKLLEDTKSAVMAQMQTKLGDIPVNRAEQTVKASAGWMQVLVDASEARKKANLDWVNVEYIKMRASEFQSEQANERTMARL